jgi:hypothetical protein
MSKAEQLFAGSLVEKLMNLVEKPDSEREPEKNESKDAD